MSSTAPRLRVLVTGGAGYIGSHTVRALRLAGHVPVVLDNLRTGHPESIAETELVVGDIRDEALVEEILEEKRIDGVIHLAGLKSVEASLRDPAMYFSVNVSGSLVLFTACQRRGVRLVVFSSSAAVYGVPSQLPVAEDHPLAPTTPYGESKLIVERLLHWFAEAYNLRFAALRYFNAAGAASDGAIGEDWLEATNLVPVVMKAALGAGPPVRVFGTDYPTADGTAVRDYIHVLDLAEAHVLALEHLAAGAPPLTVNLGTGRGSSVREVLAMTGRVAGRQVPFDLAPRREGDPPSIWADGARAKELLGWEPTRGLEEIIASAYRWHSSHPHGFAASRKEST